MVAHGGLRSLQRVQALLHTGNITRVFNGNKSGGSFDGFADGAGESSGLNVWLNSGFGFGDDGDDDGLPDGKGMNILFGIIIAE